MANIGVEVTTGLRSGPSNTGAPTGLLHIGGLTERGPATTSLSVASLAQYEARYGARTAYATTMYDTARLFFEEGGSQLVVSRAVGPAATKGFLVLKDSLAVDTAKLEAVNPGAYSTGLSVTVTSDAGDMFSVTVLDGSSPVAVFRNLESVAELVSASTANTSIKVTDLGSASAGPAANPVALTATALSAGTDDRAGVNAAAVITALATAEEAAAGGAVAAPGFSADIIGTALLAHAAGANKAALLATSATSTTDEALVEAAALNADVNGSYGALFYPHLIIPDGSGTRTISPEGYIGAVRARAFKETGFWQVPAGDRARTQWVIGTVTPVNVEKNNALSEGLVNGIVTTNGRVRLYNWTSLAADRDNLALLSARDVLNNLTVQVKAALEPYVFATLDGRGWLLSHVESAIESVLAPVATAGGFYPRTDDGEEIDPGYLVRVDTTNNTLDTGALNTVIADISVRLSPTAALIKVEIVKVALAAAL
ncbi:hypothetical protein ACQCSX_04450 [Pseudarthrobacter sp. P1]|uniref:hypothetical protein n=1 Tax=Pseudarthrobacter sp. P1 TaxID=3418418 RepID=UPI003CF90AB4